MNLVKQVAKIGALGSLPEEPLVTVGLNLNSFHDQFVQILSSVWPIGTNSEQVKNKKVDVREIVRGHTFTICLCKDEVGWAVLKMKIMAKGVVFWEIRWSWIVRDNELRLSRRRSAIVRDWWRWPRSWKGQFLMHTWWVFFHRKFDQIANMCSQDPLSDYESDFSPELSFAKTSGWKKSEWVDGINWPTTVDHVL